VFYSGLAAGNHDELLARLRTTQPPVVVLIAPPGYGKNRLAASYAASFDSYIISRADALDEAELEAWAAEEAPSCLVIQDAHRIAEDAFHALLERLVLQLPPGGALVVTSVREFGFPLSGFVQPHLAVTLRVPDLRISIEQLRALAPPDSRIDDISLYRIYQLSGGWPAVVYYFLAAASRGQFDRDLKRLHNDAWADIFDWLGAYLLEMLEPAVWSALLEAAARMDARFEDFGPPGPQNPANRLVRHLQLADVGITGEVRVAPFVRLYLHVRSRRGLTNAALEVLERERTVAPIRAARALINVGELRCAEDLMSTMDQFSCLSVGDYAYPGVFLERLSPVTPPYQLYPRVWLALNIARGFVVGTVSIAEEGATVLASGSLPPEIQRWIRFVTAITFIRAGKLNVALGLIEDIEHDASEEAQSLAGIASSVIDVVNGQYQRAIDRWNANCAPMLRSPTVYGLGLRHIARAYFATAAPTRAREHLRLMSSITSLGTSPFVYAIAAVEATVHAWLLGNDDEFIQRRREVLNLILHYEAPVYWRLVAAMHDLALAGASEGDPYLEAMANLMLGCQSREDANSFAQAAVREADESQSVFLRCSTRVVSAIRAPASAGARLCEVRDIARRTDTPPVIASIEELGETPSEALHFHSLIERARRGMKSQPPSAGQHEVDVVLGQVLASGKRVRVSDGVLQLITCLAVNRNGISRERLIDLMWPEQDAVSALAALKMCVHRARVQLGKSDSIVVQRGTYSLAPSIATNYHALLELAARTVSLPLPQDVRAAYDRAVSNIWESGEAAWGSRWAWFLPYQRAIGDAGQSMAAFLVRDAIDRGEHDRALITARGMAAMRPFDERPRMMIVQTYVAMSQFAEARREYDDFQSLLRKELGMEASSEFRALLKGA
jgi:DNA-binding SARP family transcriptional activator